MSIAVTAAVTVLPLVVVSQLGRSNGLPALLLHVLLAVALSMLIAALLAGLWTRHERSTDLVFGDLLLWGWLRRVLAERRLERTEGELAGLVRDGEDRAKLLRRMNALLEARDPYTLGHSRRVARHAERIAQQLGLPPEQIERIRAAALVHDIGKIHVPRPILTKPGKLTDGEFALVKRHAADGAAIVASLGDPEVTAIVRSHHERVDGTGYPDGLAGPDIPIGARVIAVADTFDAITSVRPYRRSRTHKQALDVLRSEAGTQLDAAAVAAFTSYYGAHRSIRWASGLLAAPQRLVTGVGGVSTGLGAGVAPLAQAACGVGGIALAGMCIGGTAMPAGSVDDQAASRASAENALVARVDTRATRPHAGGRAEEQREHRRQGGGHGRGDGTSAEGGAGSGDPPALRVPGSGSGGGSGAPSVPAPGSAVDTVDDTLPDVPDPAAPGPVQLPEPGEVVDGVTDELPALPKVQAPQVPQVDLPALKLP